MTRAAGWIGFAALAAVAALRAVTASGARPEWRADANARAAIFQTLAANEPAQRAQAARAFPGDPWSADDDFHNHEQRSARWIAAARGVGIADVLRAVDEGLRDPALRATSRAPLVATVPPCHPRPVY